MGKTTAKASSPISLTKNGQLLELLDQIEKGNISNELIIQRLLEMVVELNKKMDALAIKIIHLADISRKVSEIHSLHFAKDFLEKENNLMEKYLAEILLSIPRRRKR